MSFIKNKYGAKIQKKLDNVLGDKLKDSPVGGMINNLLGLPPKAAPSAPAQQQAPAATPEGEATPQVQEVQPEQQPAQEQPAKEEPQPTLEQQLIKGLFDKL